MMASEAELIERSRRGDSGAFSGLIARYEDRIFNLAHKVCAGLPAEAEDVYQETFLTAFKKLSQFRSDSNLGTWLYRIASNLCWMRLRQRRRDPVVAILDHPPESHAGSGAGPLFKDWSVDPADVERKKVLREAVVQAMSELPVEYRLVVVLKDIQGLSNEGIAKVLKLRVPAVKSRLRRGRLFLRERLDKVVGEGASS